MVTPPYFTVVLSSCPLGRACRVFRPDGAAPCAIAPAPNGYIIQNIVYTLHQFYYKRTAEER
jgi:hypothetical protein